MTDKELRRLRRAELLEMLLEQGRENERLRAELAEARECLKQRRIQVAEAGSIAEAALKLNRVFEAAQQAADQYLENIKERQREQQEEPQKVQQKNQKEELQKAQQKEQQKEQQENQQKEQRNELETGQAAGMGLQVE